MTLIDRNRPPKMRAGVVAIIFLRGIASAAEPADTYDPTPLGQFLIEQINRARLDPVAEAERLGVDLSDDPASPAPVAPLTPDADLARAAIRHIEDLTGSEIFSHVGSDGSTTEDRADDAGYRWMEIGENIHASPGLGTGKSTGIRIHEDLFRSAAHRRVILHPDYVDIGIAQSNPSASAPAGLRGNLLYSTEVFGARLGSTTPSLTGVVFGDKDGDGSYSPGEGIGGITVRLRGGSTDSVSSPSGGYALPLPPGTAPAHIEVRGKGIDVDLTVATTGENRKVDIVPTGNTAWVRHPAYGWLGSGGDGWFFSDEHGWLWSSDLEWCWSDREGAWLWAPLGGPGQWVYHLKTAAWEKHPPL